MPVIYEIDQAHGIIRTRCVGFVTFFDVADHFRELEQDPNCPDRLDVVLDLSEMTSLPSSAQLRAVSVEISRIHNRVRFDACAIVAVSDAIAGAAMVFEVVAASNFRVTKVLRNLDGAEAWLAAQRSPDGGHNKY